MCVRVFITEINSNDFFIFKNTHILRNKGTRQICKILSKYEVFMLLTMNKEKE